MMTVLQQEYELDYWRKVDRPSYALRQKELLRLWRFTGAPSVLEVGSGPFGGCLPYVDAQRKVACDPMFGEYAKADLKLFDGCERIAMPIEDFRAEPFDAILCANVLDHGDSDFTAIDAIAKLLKPGGRFYLHVNLRAPHQLNEGHDHCLRYEDLLSAIERSRLEVVWSNVTTHDPLEPRTPYMTVMGVWEK